MSGDDTKRANPGLMASVRLRTDIVRAFSFFFDVTGDWYAHAYTYEVADAALIEYGAIQIGFIVGVSLQLALI
jgi:hypothetical protein